MITTLLNTLQTVGRVAERVENSDVTFKDSDIELITSKGSITNLLSTFIIEPTIVISDSLKGTDAAEDVIWSNINIFTSFYIQAFHLLVSQYGLKSHIAFDILSSNKASSTSVYKTIKAGFESEAMGVLPLSADSEEYLAGLESISDFSAGSRYDGGSAIKSKKDESLVYFKEIEITIDMEERTIVMPVTVRANIIYTGFNDILGLVKEEGDEKSFGARLDKWRAGLISFGDMLLASDLIDDYKHKRVKDHNELLGDLEERKVAAYSKLHRGAIGYNLYYNMLIVSQDELDVIEHAVNGKLDKDRYKEKVLGQSKSLGLSVVDLDYETVEIFIKDLKGSSEISFKNLKKGQKKDDVTEIFKALVANKSIF